MFIWSGIRTTIEAALQIIKGIIEIVTGIIQGHWGKVWNGIKDILSGVWHLISGIVTDAINLLKSTIGNGIDAAVNLFKNMPGAILKALGNTAQWLIDAGKQIIQGLINGIKSMGGGIVDAVKGTIGGALDHIPGGGAVKKFLKLASGGVFTHPTMALIGEAGPELVLPLSDARRMQELLSQAQRRGLLPRTPHATAGFVPPPQRAEGPAPRSVVVQSGAVQLTVQGSLDSATLPQVQRMLDDTVDELSRQLS
jgi:hypothetical protein